jgi:CBS-domain-containing membrane protein
MWSNDCGVIPVIEGPNRKVLGTITDRDICMGLVTSGKAPHERKVREVMSRDPHTIGPDMEADAALDAMAKYRVRRLPVVDTHGVLQGIVSLNDLVQFAEEPRTGERPRVSQLKFVRTLQAICAHPSPEARTTTKAEIATALK